MSERTVAAQLAQFSRREARARVGRLRARALFIAQCGVAAGLAWFIAHTLLHHPAPLFAPITAIVCLGLSYGHRVRRSVELMAGVSLGVLVGDVFVSIFGTGLWQVAVVTTVAMSLAALLGSGQLITTQAGVQALFITTFAAPSQGFSRWIDAVVGGAVAVGFALVGPRAPLERPRLAVADLLVDVANLLRASAAGLRAGDADALAMVLDRGRATEDSLGHLRQLTAEAAAVVRQSPLRRGQADDVRYAAGLVSTLDLAIRNLRVLLRRSHVLARRDDPLPDGLTALLDDLAGAAEEVGFVVRRGVDEPRAVRARLVQLAAQSDRVEGGESLSAEVVRAQVRSLIVDLLMLTGLDYDDAVDLIPRS